MREWYPDHTKGVYRPEVGDLVAHDHAVWRVVNIDDRLEVDWNDDERARVAARKPEYQAQYRPFVVVLRPIGVSDNDPKAWNHDRLLSYRGRHIGRWHVYRDDHYPICARCGEPTPCRERLAAEEGQRVMRRMDRYENPDRCPHCEGVITSRQRSITFTENMIVPLGPPVVFHQRKECRHAASEYEKEWAAEDPANRPLTLSCRGRLTTHGDETYECTADAACPGPMTFHNFYTVCGHTCCPSNRDCTPWQHYQRRDSRATRCS